MRDRIRALVEAELHDEPEGPERDAFRAALCEPAEVEVQFAGGILQTCWTVTDPNGPYRVIFMPEAGYFSLCVEGPFGPLDIGVHGRAIGCFGSV